MPNLYGCISTIIEDSAGYQVVSSAKSSKKHSDYQVIPSSLSEGPPALPVRPDKGSNILNKTFDAAITKVTKTFSSKATSDGNNSPALPPRNEIRPKPSMKLINKAEDLNKRPYMNSSVVQNKRNDYEITTKPKVVINRIGTDSDDVILHNNQLARNKTTLEKDVANIRQQVSPLQKPNNDSGSIYASLGDVPKQVDAMTQQQLASAVRHIFPKNPEYANKLLADEIDGVIVKSISEQLFEREYGFKAIDAIKMVRFVKEGWKPQRDDSRNERL